MTDKDRAFVEHIQNAINNSEADHDYIKRTLLVELASDLKRQGACMNSLIKLIDHAGLDQSAARGE